MSYFIESFYEENYRVWIKSGSVFDDPEIFEKKLKNYGVYL